MHGKMVLVSVENQLLFFVANPSKVVLGGANLARARSGVERECSVSLAWNSSLQVWLMLLICNDERWIWIDSPSFKATRRRLFKANTGILQNRTARPYT